MNSILSSNKRPAAVLFDLDGTLLDSAPDLVGAVNALRVARDLPELPYETLRGFSSHGAKGLLGAGLGVSDTDPSFEALKTEFLDYYQQNCCKKTSIFDGVLVLLQTLESHHIPWGIVTNKHARFTEPVVQGFGWYGRAAVVVSGDTVAKAKPDAMPLLYAAAQLGVDPADCIYVGDDERDIQSARAAGYRSTYAAAYGYGNQTDIPCWEADEVLEKPTDLLKWIDI